MTNIKSTVQNKLKATGQMCPVCDDSRLVCMSIGQKNYLVEFDSCGKQIGEAKPMGACAVDANGVLFPFNDNGDQIISLEVDMDFTGATTSGSTITFNNEDGTSFDFDVCQIVAQYCNSPMTLGPDGTITYVDNAGEETVIQPSKVEDNGDGTATITQGDGSVKGNLICGVQSGTKLDEETGIYTTTLNDGSELETCDRQFKGVRLNEDTGQYEAFDQNGDAYDIPINITRSEVNPDGNTVTLTDGITGEACTLPKLEQDQVLAGYEVVPDTTDDGVTQWQWNWLINDINGNLVQTIPGPILEVPEFVSKAGVKLTGPITPMLLSDFVAGTAAAGDLHVVIGLDGSCKLVPGATLTSDPATGGSSSNYVGVDNTGATVNCAISHVVPLKKDGSNYAKGDTPKLFDLDELDDPARGPIKDLRIEDGGLCITYCDDTEFAVSNTEECSSGFSPYSAVIVDSATPVGPILSAQSEICIDVDRGKCGGVATGVYQYSWSRLETSSFNAGGSVFFQPQRSCNGGATWTINSTGGWDQVHAVLPVETNPTTPTSATSGFYGHNEQQFEDRFCCDLPPGVTTVCIRPFVVTNALDDGVSIIQNRSALDITTNKFSEC